MRPLGWRYTRVLATGLCISLVASQAVPVQKQVTTADITAINDAMDASFVFVCACLVYFMQLGFAMLEAGSIRSKNVTNILMKNLADSCLSAIMFFCCGYAFAYGVPSDESLANPIFGRRYFFFIDMDDTQWLKWFFNWGFSATATTIVSGAIAERVKIQGYMVYAGVLGGVVYPITVYWVWSTKGWASAYISEPGDRLFDAGVYDVAGCLPVHFVGGMTALVGTVMVGPRIGRFSGWTITLRENNPFRPSSTPLQAMGMIILWFGWFGFNAGSVGGVSNGQYVAVARSLVCTALSGACGGLGSLVILHVVNWPQMSLNSVINGVLSGLVSITASCAIIDPWISPFVGVMGAVLYVVVSKANAIFHIDDPIDAIPVHMACGIFGFLLPPFVAKKSFVQDIYGSSTSAYGIFYGGGFELLAAHVVCLLAVSAWVGFMALCTFSVLRFTDLLRIAPAVENAGSDSVSHGGEAFDWLAKLTGLKVAMMEVSGSQASQGDGASSAETTDDRSTTMGDRDLNEIKHKNRKRKTSDSGRD